MLYISASRSLKYTCALATSYKGYTTAEATANRLLVAQCKGLFQHPVQLQGGWPEDGTDCPPLSTAAMSSPS